VSVKAAMYALLAEREQTPPEVKHCVAKVAAKYGGDTSRAFAICVAAKQKGHLGKRKKTDPKTLKKYEKLLKKAREK
jgi:hypothetical protein